ncbi:hypothetical protein V3C99_010932 [Haemonchus contortus]
MAPVVMRLSLLGLLLLSSTVLCAAWKCEPSKNPKADADRVLCLRFGKKGKLKKLESCNQIAVERGTASIKSGKRPQNKCHEDPWLECYCEGGFDQCYKSSTVR